MCRRMSDRRYRAGLIKHKQKRNIYIKKPVVSDRFFYALLQNLSHLIPIPSKFLFLYTGPEKWKTPWRSSRCFRSPLVFPLIRADDLVEALEALFLPLIRDPHQVFQLLHQFIMHQIADILAQFFAVFLDRAPDDLVHDLLKLAHLLPRQRLGNLCLRQFCFLVFYLCIFF